MTPLDLPIYLACLAALLVVLLSFVVSKDKNESKYPPGPRPLPLIGNLHQIEKLTHKSFQKWAREYGPIVRIKLGSQNVIIITDPKLMRELFSENVSAGRPNNAVTSVYGGANRGFLNSDGPTWEEQRRFAIRTLKDFGFATRSLEGMILEEALSVTKYFEKRVGTPVSGKRIFNGPVVNSLWHIVTGERNEWDGPVEPEIITNTSEVIDASNKLFDSGVMFAPFLRFFAPQYTGWRQWCQSIQGLFKLTDIAVEKHVPELHSRAPSDFIDHFLRQIESTHEPNSSFFKEIGRENLNITTADLFIGGSETTSTSLEWALLYFSHYKQVQQNLHEELDRVIGLSRPPSLSDRPALPYTEAVIMEIFRLSSILSIGLMHRMMGDKEFHGYLLPKNAMLFSNLYSIHHDPKIWGDNVEEFVPERFLNEDRTGVIRHEALLPFNTGKRVCPGEAIGKDTLFLFLTCILQKFEIHPDPDCPKPDFGPGGGFLRQPKPFKVIMKNRQSKSC